MSISLIHASLGIALSEQNRLEEAISPALRCLEYCEEIYPHHAFMAHVVLARSYHCILAYADMADVGQKLGTILKTFPNLPHISFSLYRTRIWVISDVVIVDAYLTRFDIGRISMSPYSRLTFQLLVLRRRMKKDATTLRDTLMQLEQLQVELNQNRFLSV